MHLALYKFCQKGRFKGMGLTVKLGFGGMFERQPERISESRHLKASLNMD